MTEPSNILSFPQLGNEEWIESYHQACLTKLNDATVDAYLRILRQFTEWVAKRPGHGKQFQPGQRRPLLMDMCHCSKSGDIVSAIAHESNP